jgi:hypothetical protein
MPLEKGNSIRRPSHINSVDNSTTLGRSGVRWWDRVEVVDHSTRTFEQFRALLASAQLH